MIANLEQTIHDLKVKTETETTESIEQLTEKHKKEIAVLSERVYNNNNQYQHYIIFVVFISVATA